MPEQLNIESFKLLNEIAFRHCTYLYKSAINEDRNGKASIPYLEQLMNAGPAEFYRVLLETFATVKNEHNKTTDSCVSPVIADSFVIWGRMYVIAYFTQYHDDFWRNSVLPRMIAMQPNKVLRAEMDSARENIDQYYKENESMMKEMIAAGAPSPEDFAVFVENEKLRARVEEQEEKIKALEEQIAKDKGIIEQLKTQKGTSKTKASGRPTQQLFKSEAIEQQQKKQVLAFLKKHNLSSQPINCEKESKLNKYLASIYWRWMDLGLVPEEPLPTAYYKFLADVCELNFDVVQKSFSNRMGIILQNKVTYPNVWGEVAEFFQK